MLPIPSTGTLPPRPSAPVAPITPPPSQPSTLRSLVGSVVTAATQPPTENVVQRVISAATTETPRGQRPGAIRSVVNLIRLPYDIFSGNLGSAIGDGIGRAWYGQ